MAFNFDLAIPTDHAGCPWCEVHFIALRVRASCRGIKGQLLDVGDVMFMPLTSFLLWALSVSVRHITSTFFFTNILKPASEGYGELLHEDGEMVSIVSDFILVALFGLQFMFGTSYHPVECSYVEARLKDGENVKRFRNLVPVQV
ncbi:hypothetical protein DAPPUDRAFT_100467 [Daphnia pulex]|uniref:Uncharacterized protein n=1 Tax=Daphnia pulex TaxID=6669 RepID=E9GAG9_DAPPU|nr:hypothetical protein DAPPUDRAFT_100467 [Daphnia pulex]|eukprot:EFX83528.1 hypothetical protein DAPPUDRAFT_100467 [Daphnia pulex]